MKQTDASVIVVGGGFAGYYTARGLSRHARVTLIDANGFQTFQPLLYQVASGLLDPGNVRYPLADIEHVTAVRATVTTVDLTQCRVLLAPPDPDRTPDASAAVPTSLTSDYLVLCPGARVNFFGVPGAIRPPALHAGRCHLDQAPVTGTGRNEGAVLRRGCRRWGHRRGNHRRPAR